MGLFWIRPHIFLNLDATNRGFLENPNCVTADLAAKMKSRLKKTPSAEEYLSIIDDCRKLMAVGSYGFNSFPELSYCAWIAPDNKHDAGLCAAQKICVCGAKTGICNRRFP